MTNTTFEFPDEDEDREKSLAPSLPQKLFRLLEDTAQITDDDLAQGTTLDTLIRNTTEELGEFCKAVSVERGYKHTLLREPAKVEAVDTVISALSLFYASGGTHDMLVRIMSQKLPKWAERVRKNQ